METYNVYKSASKKSKLNHHISNHSVFPKGHKLIHFPVVDMRNLFEFLGRLSMRIPKPSQAIAIALGRLTEVKGMSLWLKTPCTPETRHRKPELDMN